MLLSACLLSIELKSDLRFELVELLSHLDGVRPVVGWTGAIFRRRADEGAALDTGDIAGIGSGQKRIWSEKSKEKCLRMRFEERYREERIGFAPEFVVETDER